LTTFIPLSDQPGVVLEDETEQLKIVVSSFWYLSMKLTNVACPGAGNWFMNLRGGSAAASCSGMLVNPSNEN
jgi:hypothetical protein